MTRERANEFLRSHGAAGVPHLNGTLLEHLDATAAVLERWGADEPLVLAGLCHATYGTDGFAPSLLPLDDRPVLVDTIGTRAEAIVYRYAACDRTFTYAQFARGTPRFRDRFTTEEVIPSDDDVRAFVDLTFANELEITWASRGVDPTGIEALLGLLRPWASPSAADALGQTDG
jgi:hypothetical protein